MYADQQTRQVNASGQYERGSASGYIGADKTPETAARQLEVVSELERLERIVEAIDVAADVLTNRLTPLRSPIGAGVGGNSATAPEPVLCGMASVLRSRRQRLEAVHARLMQAANELEI